MTPLEKYARYKAFCDEHCKEAPRLHDEVAPMRFADINPEVHAMMYERPEFLPGFDD